MNSNYHNYPDYRHSYHRPPRKTGASKVPVMVLFFLLGAIIALDKLFVLKYNWVDYTVIGIIFVAALAGYAKGMVSTLFSLVSYIAGMFCAVFFSPVVALFIMEKTKIDEKVAAIIGKQLSNLGLPAFKQSVEMSGFKNLDQLTKAFPELNKYLSQNDMMKKLLETQNPFQSLLPNAPQITSVSDVLVLTILKVVSLIAIFIVVKLIISIIGKIINSLIMESRFLSTTNKTIGMLMGVVIGCVIVFTVVTYIVPFMGSLKFFTIPDAYQQSKVLGYFFSAL